MDTALVRSLKHRKRQNFKSLITLTPGGISTPFKGGRIAWKRSQGCWLPARRFQVWSPMSQPSCILQEDVRPTLAPPRDQVRTSCRIRTSCLIRSAQEEACACAHSVPFTTAVLHMCRAQKCTPMWFNSCVRNQHMFWLHGCLLNINAFYFKQNHNYCEEPTE